MTAGSGPPAAPADRARPIQALRLLEAVTPSPFPQVFLDPVHHDDLPVPERPTNSIDPASVSMALA